MQSIRFLRHRMVFYQLGRLTRLPKQDTNNVPMVRSLIHYCDSPAGWISPIGWGALFAYCGEEGIARRTWV